MHENLEKILRYFAISVNFHPQGSSMAKGRHTLPDANDVKGAPKNLDIFNILRIELESLETRIQFPKK